MKTTITILLAALLFASCTNNYSEGERTGIITKFSKKGVVWKSWEGDLKVAPNIANGGMVGQYEDFLFSIDNDATIQFIGSIDSIELYSRLGVPVVVTYQQTAGMNWFTNRGETDYFIVNVQRASHQ